MHSSQKCRFVRNSPKTPAQTPAHVPWSDLPTLRFLSQLSKYLTAADRNAEAAQKRERATASQAAGFNGYHRDEDEAWVEQESFKMPILQCPEGRDSLGEQALG